ncbi:transferase [Ancylobacter radicis]|uniref:Transferase n=1 Tax=Ancylobacter radicis TaxID=2836179 RepID=A0ABS5R8V7_9HYPH|nr:transferase [Ancylobacter radicis]MBS9478105.1 transferase [Ancylobacter radicis]
MLQALKVMTTTVSLPVAREAETTRPAFARRDPLTVTQLMSQHLDLASPGTDAEALRLLRQAFPGAPLTARVEAMAARRAR